MAAEAIIETRADQVTSFKIQNNYYLKKKGKPFDLKGAISQLKRNFTVLEEDITSTKLSEGRIEYKVPYLVEE